MTYIGGKNQGRLVQTLEWKRPLALRSRLTWSVNSTSLGAGVQGYKYKGVSCAKMVERCGWSCAVV